MILAQEIIQGRIGIEASETIDVVDGFYRNVSCLTFRVVFVDRREAEGIIPAGHPPRVKQIVCFFHDTGLFFSNPAKFKETARFTFTDG